MGKERAAYRETWLRHEGNALKRQKKQAESPKRDQKAAEGAVKPRTTRKKAVRLPEYPDPVDDALADSFPASDPPSWAGR